MAAFMERIAQKLEPWRVRLGKVTLICGLGMVTLGFPAQIYSNWKQKECGINLLLIAVAMALYAVRIPYQASTRAWYLVPSDALGLLLSVILIIQYLIY